MTTQGDNVDATTKVRPTPEGSKTIELVVNYRLLKKAACRWQLSLPRIESRDLLGRLTPLARGTTGVLPEGRPVTEGTA